MGMIPYIIEQTSRGERTMMKVNISFCVKRISIDK